MWEGITWAINKLIGGAEYVGEIVANVIGLNESKFQYVMDSMTEEEWAEARRINDLRQAQDSRSMPPSFDVDESHELESQTRFPEEAVTDQASTTE
jgi:hypothetical protein